MGAQRSERGVGATLDWWIWRVGGVDGRVWDIDAGEAVGIYVSTLDGCGIEVGCCDLKTRFEDVGGGWKA
jgi:hypothetical protein